MYHPVPNILYVYRWMWLSDLVFVLWKKKVNFESYRWSVRCSHFPHNSENCLPLCSESSSQHLTALTLHRRRLSLMITAFQFWLSASGKTNRARAGVCQLVGYSLQTQHRKSCWCDDFSSPPTQKEWNGSKEDIKTFTLRLVLKRDSSVITGSDTGVLLIHKIP